MYEGNEQSKLDLHLYRIWMKAFRAVFNNVRADIAKYGLREDQFIILELLYNEGPHPIQRISERFSIPSGSITYVVDKLEKMEYVERKPSPTDRRGCHVVLTDKGEHLFNDIFPKHADTISENLSFATNEEKYQLIELLKKIGLGAEGLCEQKPSKGDIKRDN